MSNLVGEGEDKGSNSNDQYYVLRVQVEELSKLHARSLRDKHTVLDSHSFTLNIK